MDSTLPSDFRSGGVVLVRNGAFWNLDSASQPQIPGITRPIRSFPLLGLQGCGNDLPVGAGLLLPLDDPCVIASRVSESVMDRSCHGSVSLGALP